ncbi:DnaD domain protein [Priestia aryabhattai]|jgi:DnaD/phage-associated family protein|uniref:DnaD domain-containing protein n=1 Tax=Priestia TaxID=2800373 RepID=UPI001EC38A80|nr:MULTISPECIES: DnaD domain protein [Priestia]MBY0091062.1 DnaD domain protein [Priestia aryabhattai]MBY0101353.1 DnaD domain protein [Priestia aryabhattai]MCM3306047.1 DnaD domain protein [Priestia megaterium]
MSQLTTGFVIQPRLAFQNKRDQVLYNFFVSEANFVSNTYCKRGQLKVRIKDLTDVFGHTDNILRACIKRLVDDGFITKKRLKGSEGLLITINNYDEHQTLASYQKSKNEAAERPKQPMKGENTVFNFFETIFGGSLSPKMAQDIGNWVDDFNGNEDVVIAAMKLAIRKKKAFWGYVQPILVDWHNKGVRTLEDARNLQNQSRREKGDKPKEVIANTSQGASGISEETQRLERIAQEKGLVTGEIRDTYVDF